MPTDTLHWRSVAWPAIQCHFKLAVKPWAMCLVQKWLVLWKGREGKPSVAGKKWRSEVKSFSRVRLFAIPWTAAHQAPLSMGFSRQGYWSGLPFPSPGYFPDPGIEPRSPALQEDTLTSEPPGNDIGEGAEGRNTFLRNEMQMLVQTTIYCKLNY